MERCLKMRKLASLLFNREKRNAENEPLAAPAAELPDAEPCASLPAAPPLEPPESLDIDTLGGEVEITYESMNAKTYKHYTQILVDISAMPSIRVFDKPDNRDYQSLKHDLLHRAFLPLKPYIDFVMSLKGMHERDDLERALELLVKRFLMRFWDLSASRDNHHSYPWGLVIHSIDVACAEAEKAQDWRPMSKHGIDEINHARYLGMVVFLHFVKGLFHDAHKLYQYEMFGYTRQFKVEFDPLRNNGNILDFKLVYPQRIEHWKEPPAHPGKLNIVEFIALFPQKLIKHVPSGQFLDVLLALFDMDGSEADKDSAKRDAIRSGRATLEEMILDQVVEYFTTERESTKPENNIFRVNDDWAAVVSSQFLMKVRPLNGGIYTKDGVKTYLQREGALSGTASKYELSLLYRLKRPYGKEEAAKSKVRIAFIKMPYLLQACPDLKEFISQIYFDENDRAAVLELCPGADNFLPDLTKKVSEQPKNKDKEPVSPQPEGQTAHDAPSEDEASAGVADAEMNVPTTPVARMVPDNQIPPYQETSEQKPEQAENAEADASEELTPPPAAEAAVPETRNVSQSVSANTSSAQTKSGAKRTIRRMEKWSKQLRFLLERYSPGDSHPISGWLYTDLYKVYVRAPNFYQKMTNDGLLEQADWRKLAEAMCLELQQEGLLSLKPVMGSLSFTAPGGGNGSTQGAFFQLTLNDDLVADLVDRVMVGRTLKL